MPYRLRARVLVQLLWPGAFLLAGSCGTPTDPDVPTLQFGSVYLEDTVRAIAHDSKRQFLYVSLPARHLVAAVDLSTLALSALIVLGPRVPAGIALSVSSDSLLIALKETRLLGSVDLREATKQLRTFPLHIEGSSAGLPSWPDNLAVLQNGKAFITISFAGFGVGGRLYEVDLSTGAQTYRLDIGTNGGFILVDAPLYAATGGRRVYLEDVVFEGARAYDFAQDTFVKVPIPLPYLGPVGLSATGALVWTGGHLYSESGARLGPLQPTAYADGPVALSGSGDRAYFGVGSHLVTLQVATGALVRDTTLDAPIVRIYAPATGDFVVAVSSNTRLHVLRP